MTANKTGRARAIMLQGTSSHVGKSLLAAALCRIFRQDGHRVAPFKAQNMALNAYVTVDGGEIGRAQGLQAEAAGVAATVEMNPILLKPKGENLAEVILRGKSAGDYSAVGYRREFLPRARAEVATAYGALAAVYRVLVIEGAGSPAEVNLREGDIANMFTAELAGAPVLLIGDIDRGGVLASLVGTLELLTADERARVKGLVINKFRGDFTLLEPALTFLRERTGLPVLGVIPHLGNVGLEEEDSLGVAHSLPTRDAAGREPGVDVAVVNFPHLSNFSDLDPLGLEPGLGVRYVSEPQRLGRPTAVLLPGSKNTVQDLAYLEASGLARAIRELAEAGTEVVGLCGGYQTLGETLHDPEGWEDHPGSCAGLGLLPAETVFGQEKTTVRTRAAAEGVGFLAGSGGGQVEGYEIHRGQTHLGAGSRPLFRDGSGRVLGAVTAGGGVWGTYLHGLWENDWFRRTWHNHLREKVGLLPLAGEPSSWVAVREERLDHLAAVVREHLNIPAVYGMLKEGGN